MIFTEMESNSVQLLWREVQYRLTSVSNTTSVQTKPPKVEETSTSPANSSNGAAGKGENFVDHDSESMRGLWQAVLVRRFALFGLLQRFQPARIGDLARKIPNLVKNRVSGLLKHLGDLSVVQADQPARIGLR